MKRKQQDGLVPIAEARSGLVGASEADPDRGFRIA